ncbi:phytoene desaturase family protein [Sandarakinorhabdus oryzae]|uniref:phytoene desaturase family protein n=1 Tax=Sandarakinorhabdus oryzae TaxID=2675220 RepID=UPI0012E21874|nr:NAD(P)/FAD-dependent oxidoreductase [Sandarakinorhabdus oryzae]
MKFDAIIIGGGHNGLVTAFYLARAGLKVHICEARDIVGGACVTEEFAPGFRNSTASYTVSLLQDKVASDMNLAEHGLKIVLRPLNNFLPLDGDYLKVGPGVTEAEVARFSPKDAAALAPYDARLEVLADQMRRLALKTPPARGLKGMTALINQGWPLMGLKPEEHRDLFTLFTRSAREFLDGWFESDPIKAVLGFDSIVGHFASPDTPGSAYVLLHHVFGQVNGVKGAWGHAIGGMGAITQAMAAAVSEKGVSIGLEERVAKVNVAGGKACGVTLEDGRELEASIVASNAGPALLFRQLVDRSELPAEFARSMDGYATGSGTFRMNVALSELPEFSVLPGRGPHHGAGIIMAPSLDYMDRAYTGAKAYGWSAKPIVEMLIPSTLDDTLAPPGCHVASLFCQQFAPKLPDGQSWDDVRDKVADLIIDTVTAHAPNFKRSVIARQIHSPLDLERKFGLIGGDIFHGRISLDQLWAARPVLGHGDHRMPIKGLYLCGSGAHPGGGVTGAPGHNAAREILADRRFAFGRA